MSFNIYNDNTINKTVFIDDYTDVGSKQLSFLLTSWIIDDNNKLVSYQTLVKEDNIYETVENISLNSVFSKVAYANYMSFLKNRDLYNLKHDDILVYDNKNFPSIMNESQCMVPDYIQTQVLLQDNDIFYLSQSEKFGNSNYVNKLFDILQNNYNKLPNTRFFISGHDSTFILCKKVKSKIYRFTDMIIDDNIMSSDNIYNGKIYGSNLLMIFSSMDQISSFTFNNLSVRQFKQLTNCIIRYSFYQWDKIIAQKIFNSIGNINKYRNQSFDIYMSFLLSFIMVKYDRPSIETLSSYIDEQSKNIHNIFLLGLKYYSNCHILSNFSINEIKDLFKVNTNVLEVNPAIQNDFKKIFINTSNKYIECVNQFTVNGFVYPFKTSTMNPSVLNTASLVFSKDRYLGDLVLYFICNYLIFSDYHYNDVIRMKNIISSIISYSTGDTYFQYISLIHDYFKRYITFFDTINNQMNVVLVNNSLVPYLKNRISKDRQLGNLSYKFNFLSYFNFVFLGISVLFSNTINLLWLFLDSLYEGINDSLEYVTLIR